MDGSRPKATIPRSSRLVPQEPRDHGFLVRIGKSWSEAAQRCSNLANPGDRHHSHAATHATHAAAHATHAAAHATHAATHATHATAHATHTTSTAAHQRKWDDRQVGHRVHADLGRHVLGVPR